ncbi:MAG TPA: penicillin-binding protein 1C [Candidatus Baltobacteraceae bacterium]|nr:penicillin-binding protein 1C [Candidatus Baltobacteraceae bacterium]
MAARALTLVAILVCAGAVALAVIAYCSGIDAAKLTTPRGSVTYTDRSGIVLGTVLGAGSDHAVSVPLRSVSPQFLQAVVAAEDARFWRHGAVDFRSLLRAARDYAVFGEARSGGSTISMQLARLIDPMPSTIGGKLRQIVMAERISIRSTKTSVLEAYVNRAPMGGNVYGVEAASRTYFGEPAADLDLAQAALLAAIPNDPDHLAPDSGWNALRRRQRFILERMASLGEITPAQAGGAFAETLAVRSRELGIADAPHALFYLYRDAGAGGGRVRTTLDRDLQRFVAAQTEDVVGALHDFHVTDAAALVVNNRSGNVLAYVGSPDYFSDSVLGRNDGVQALRQPGSSLKPFTYELALERGTIRSTSILADTAAAYALPNGTLYEPQDYSGKFSGPVRVRYALANSLNAPAVQVLSRLGVDALLARLHELGFNHLDRPASYYGLGLTLGGGEVSLWELVQAYSAVARGGRLLPLTLVAGNDGAPPQDVGETPYWQLIADILADPYARAKSFGVGSVLQMPFPAAVKTGTSSDFRDTWTVGFTRDFTVGVWVGNFDGTPMRGVSGVTGAGPLWNRIMLHLYENGDEPARFDSPRGFVRAPICATTGHAPARGTQCAIVKEWVRREDVAMVEAPPPRSPAAAQELQIVFPHDGDVFVQNPTATALQAREQRIALHASGAKANVRWSVAGTTLALDAGGNAFWPLRVGTWRIAASDGLRHDAVTIRVVPQREKRPGFSRSP